MTEVRPAAAAPAAGDDNNFHTGQLLLLPGTPFLRRASAPAPAGCEPDPFFLNQATGMSGVPFVSVRQLLGSSLTPLGRLMAAGRRLGAANTALDEFLDEPLKSRIRVARAGPETLTLVAESPAWSARVRYLTPQILDHMRRRLENPRLNKVQIVTRPTETPADPRPVRRAELSRGSAELIESVARATDNEALAQVLTRLAKRCEDRKQDRNS